LSAMTANRTALGAETRLALLEEDMERLLGNGRPGLIQDLRDDIGAVKELVFKARYVFLGCFAAVMLMLMLSGSGTVSLKTLLQVLKP
jgi:hypothetical protein